MDGDETAQGPRFTPPSQSSSSVLSPAVPPGRKRPSTRPTLWPRRSIAHRRALIQERSQAVDFVVGGSGASLRLSASIWRAGVHQPSLLRRSVVAQGRGQRTGSLYASSSEDA